MIQRLSRTGKMSVAFLVVAIMLWFFAMTWMMHTYQRFYPRPMARFTLLRQIDHILKLSSALPTEQLPHVLAAFNSRWLFCKVLPKPLPHSHQFKTRAIHPLITIVRNQQHDLRFAWRLKDGQWLNIHIRHPHGHGHIKWVLWFAMALLCIGLLIFCFWLIARLTASLNHLDGQERIQNLLRDRTHMLAAISHDLRTPITRLKLRAEYLEDTPQYDRMIQDLEEMEQMIQSVLNFAQQDNRDESLTRFDMCALLSSMIDDLSDAGYAIQFETTLQRLPFMGRLIALKRAFGNVFDNALKYAKQAQCTLRCEENTLVIIIDDDGPGIPDSELSLVFEPFYRVEPSRSRQTGGTGLGLVVTRDVIRSHGGDVELINLPEQGLRVQIVLPMR